MNASKMNFGKKLMAALSCVCVSATAVATFAFAPVGIQAFALTEAAESGELVLGGEAVSVTVNREQPQTLTLSGVSEGQYLLQLDNVRTDAQSEWFTASLYVKTGSQAGEQYMNYASGVYRAVITVSGEGESITLSTPASEAVEVEGETVERTVTVTADAKLTVLSLGVGYDYSLDGVVIPDKGSVEIALVDVPAGNYLFLADIGVYEEDSNVNISVSCGGKSSSLTYNGEYFSYAAETEVKEGVSLVTVSNQSGKDYTANIALEEAPAPAQVLPGRVDMVLYEPVAAVYTAETSGWYTPVFSDASVENPDIALWAYTDDYWNGQELSAGVPVYLSAGVPLNIEITFVGLADGGSADSASVYMDFTAYTVETLGVSTEDADNAELIPVAAEEEAEYPVTLVGYEEGKYTLEITDIPYSAIMNGLVITALVNGAEYTMENGAAGYATTIELPAYDAEAPVELILIASYEGEYSENFAAMVTLTAGELENPDTDEHVVTLGEEVSVTLTGTDNFTVYHLLGLEEGTYRITLTYTDGSGVTVETNLQMGEAVVPSDKTEGTFVVPASEENKTDVDLLFEFFGEETATVSFTFKVEKV